MHLQVRYLCHARVSLFTCALAVPQLDPCVQSFSTLNLVADASDCLLLPLPVQACGLAALQGSVALALLWGR
jgi:hypothetical protein